MTNRKPIYNKDHEGMRVISVPNNLWVAQKRVSHTAGCNRGWRRDKDNMLLGVDGYDAMKMLKLSRHARHRAMQEFPHRDPWQSVGGHVDRSAAIMMAFGPKTASQIV